MVSPLLLSQSLFLAGQLLVQHAHLAEVLQRLFGLLLVDLGERKPNVDNGIVAHLDLRHVVQANPLHYPAKVHPPNAKIAIGGYFLDFSRNR